jgi:hypothetical protein
VETLHARQKLGATECELLYESAFLYSIARFEGLLNALLGEFVCGQTSANVGHYSLIVPRNRPTFRNVLTGGRPYIELMPFGRCVEISKRFLNNGKPFSDVDSADQHILAQAVLVRNAIAHRSDTAIKVFRSKVSGVNSLPANRQQPGAYLRRVYRAHPVASWNDLYLDTLEKVGGQLSLSW